MSQIGDRALSCMVWRQHVGGGASAVMVNAVPKKMPAASTVMRSFLIVLCLPFEEWPIHTAA